MQERFSTQSLYLRVVDVLVDRIATSVWKPGAAIPNEGDLAREFGVSPGTMRKALDALEQEHLLTRSQGRGTFVKDPTSEDQVARFCHLRAPSGEPVRGDIRTLRITEGTASGPECARLRLARQDRVYRIKRSRAYTGEPFMVEDVSLPATLFPGLVERAISPFGSRELAQAYGILLANGEERVSIGAASSLASAVLKIAKASPVLCLDRVLMTRDGRPVDWRRGECVLGAMHYVVVMN